MARCYRVKKCRKDQGKCSKCGDKLPIGSPYRYWKPRSGLYARTIKRCMKPGCTATRAELTSSGHLSTLWYLVGNADFGGYATPAEVGEELASIAEKVRDEVAAGYRESAENIREHICESPSIEIRYLPYREFEIELCDEKADELDGFADELEMVADGISNMDPDDEEDEDDAQLEEAIEQAQDALSNCPL
jgi:hypothetical protein